MKFKYKATKPLTPSSNPAQPSVCCHRSVSPPKMAKTIVSQKTSMWRSMDAVAQTKRGIPIQHMQSGLKRREAQNGPEPGDYVSHIHECSSVKSLSIHQGWALKCCHPPAAHRLEPVLFKCIIVQSDKGVQMDSPLTLQFARKRQGEANQLLPFDNQLTFKFSSGWMEKFKKRYG